MILWHLGLTLLIVRYVFRDPKMDLRWVLFGSVLPDLIDKPIGSLLFHDVFGTHRLFAHAVVFPVVLLAIVMLATRRGTTGRKAAIAVVIGCFVHLLLDGVWTNPEAFLWPLFGIEFPEVAGSAFFTLIGNMMRSPFMWAGEAVGLAYLVFLWRRYLDEPGDLRRFAGDGRIAMREAGPTSR